MFNSTPTSCNMSLIVNLRSAITKIPALFCTQIKNPDTCVSSTSDIEPTYNGDMKETQPFGVQAIKNLAACNCSMWTIVCVGLLESL